MLQEENDNKKDIFESYKTGIRVVENMRSFENDPVFLKKKEEAYQALKEVPLPEHLLKRLERD